MGRDGFKVSPGLYTWVLGVSTRVKSCLLNLLVPDPQILLFSHANYNGKGCYATAFAPGQVISHKFFIGDLSSSL